MISLRVISLLMTSQQACLIQYGFATNRFKTREAGTVASGYRLCGNLHYDLSIMLASKETSATCDCSDSLTTVVLRKLIQILQGSTPKGQHGLLL